MKHHEIVVIQKKERARDLSGREQQKKSISPRVQKKEKSLQETLIKII